MFKPGELAKVKATQTDPKEQWFNMLSVTAKEIAEEKTESITIEDATRKAKVRKWADMVKIPMEPIEVIPADSTVTILQGYGQNVGSEEKPDYLTYYVETSDGRIRSIKRENLSRLS